MGFAITRGKRDRPRRWSVGLGQYSALAIYATLCHLSRDGGSRGQKIVAMALASKRFDLGLDLKDHWPLP